MLFLVHLADDGGDVFFGEVADGRGEKLLVFGQLGEGCGLERKSRDGEKFGHSKPRPVGKTGART